jgi:hypothetical protein
VSKQSTSAESTEASEAKVSAPPKKTNTPNAGAAKNGKSSILARLSGGAKKTESAPVAQPAKKTGGLSMRDRLKAQAAEDEPTPDFGVRPLGDGPKTGGASMFNKALQNAAGARKRQRDDSATTTSSNVDVSASKRQKTEEVAASTEEQQEEQYGEEGEQQEEYAEGEEYYEEGAAEGEGEDVGEVPDDLEGLDADGDIGEVPDDINI